MQNAGRAAVPMRGSDAYASTASLRGPELRGQGIGRRGRRQQPNHLQKRIAVPEFLRDEH